MATTNTFPPDVPKPDISSSDLADDLDGARHTAETLGRNLRAKASNLADKASETAREAFDSARDAVTEADPARMARDGGGALLRAVERHPLVAFGLGAFSAGLVAWSALRRPPASRWERYMPDYGRLRGLWQERGGEALAAGERALRSGGSWLDGQRGQARDYAELARDYADHGGRALAKRAEREPIAALIGVGIAVYVIGSLLTSAAARASSEASGAVSRSTSEPGSRKRQARR